MTTPGRDTETLHGLATELILAGWDLVGVGRGYYRLTHPALPNHQVIIPTDELAPDYEASKADAVAALKAVHTAGQAAATALRLDDDADLRATHTEALHLLNRLHRFTGFLATRMPDGFTAYDEIADGDSHAMYTAVSELLNREHVW